MHTMSYLVWLIYLQVTIAYGDGNNYQFVVSYVLDQNNNNRQHHQYQDYEDVIVRRRIIRKKSTIEIEPINSEREREKIKHSTSNANISFCQCFTRSHRLKTTFFGSHLQEIVHWLAFDFSRTSPSIKTNKKYKRSSSSDVLVRQMHIQTLIKFWRRAASSSSHQKRK